MYTPEQIERFARRLRDRHAVETEEVAGALGAYAATLRQAHAQGGVTEAMNWTEFWNRISQNFDSADVDKVHACYKAALSAEPAVPEIHISCETESDGIKGSTSLRVIRVDPEDDGSFTAVTDHWPQPAEPAAQGEAVNAPGYDVGWKIRGVTAYDEAKRKGYRHPECVEAAIKAAPPARPATPDGLTTEDRKWLDQIRKELFQRLDAAQRNPATANANARIEAFDKLMALSAQPAERVPDIHVSAQGVRFGPNCWYSHEWITRVSADRLNEGKCGIPAREYMKWVREQIAASPAPSPARGDGGEG